MCRTLLFLPLLLCAAPAQAWELAVHLEFAGRAPVSVVAYLPEDDSRDGSRNVLDQKDKTFIPEVVMLRPEDPLVIRNSDEVDHNVYADDRELGVKFDIGLRPPGSSVPVRADWPEGKLVKLSCQIHPRMRAWVLPISSGLARSFAVPKRARSFDFSLKNLPERFGQVRLLVPAYEPVELMLRPGQTRTAPLTRRGRPQGTALLRRIP